VRPGLGVNMHKCRNSLTISLYLSLDKVDLLPMFLYALIEVSYLMEGALPLKRKFVGEFTSIIIQLILVQIFIFTYKMMISIC
jgi:hypothetical protein